MSKFGARAFVLCAAGLISAAAAAGQVKVGIVNMQKAILETGEIKKAQAALEAKYKPRQAELEKLQKELSDMQAQLEGGKLNPQAAQETQARGQRKQREAQRLAEDLQGDVDRERNEILQGASQRMSDVIKKLAEERGLDVVVDVNNTLYFKPALELTAEAVTAFDKAYPVK
jgi:outer membrane protein